MLLLPQMSYAGTATSNNTVDIGAMISGGVRATVPGSDLLNVVAIVAGNVAGTTGNFNGFIKIAGGSTLGGPNHGDVYFVPPNKTFCAFQILTGTATAAANGTNFGYSSAATASDAASPRVGRKNYSQAPDHTGSPYFLEISSATAYNGYPIPMCFPAGKYPWAQAQQSGRFSVILVGREI